MINIKFINRQSKPDITTQLLTYHHYDNVGRSTMHVLASLTYLYVILGSLDSLSPPSDQGQSLNSGSLFYAILTELSY